MELCEENQNGRMCGRKRGCSRSAGYSLPSSSLASSTPSLAGHIGFVPRLMKGGGRQPQCGWVPPSRTFHLAIRAINQNHSRVSVVTPPEGDGHFPQILPARAATRVELPALSRNTSSRSTFRPCSCGTDDIPIDPGSSTRQGRQRAGAPLPSLRTP